MSIWGILGIEPTNDVRAIKRAYAKKLKVTHPDDDLEAFQALKEAFDTALSYANNSSYREDIHREDEYFKVDEEHEEKTYEEYDESYNNLNKEIDENHNNSYEDNYNILNNEDNIGNEDIKDYNRKKEEEYEKNSGLLEEEDDCEFSEYNEEASELSFAYFTDEVNRIYNDFNLRIDISRWESLLNSNLTWNVTDSKEYQKFLLNFIVEKHKLIPQYVISLILRYFSLDASCLEESGFFNNSIDKKYLKQIFNPPAFSFSSLEKLKDKEKEKFLESRYDAYIDIINRRYVFARMKIRNCKRILKNNADLILLETFIFLKGYKYSMFKPKLFSKKKYMKASMDINRAIELDKYNPTARLFRLSIMQALKIDVIASDIDIAENGDTYLLSKEYVLGLIYYKLGDLRKSYHMLISLKDDRKKYTRRKIARTIRGFRNQYKKEIKEDISDIDAKNNIKSLGEQLQLFSKIAFLKTYFKSPKALFFLPFFIILIIAFSMAPSDGEYLGYRNIYTISKGQDLENAYNDSNRAKINLDSNSEIYFLGDDGLQYVLTEIKDGDSDNNYGVIVALNTAYKNYSEKDVEFIGEIKEITSIPKEAVNHISANSIMPISSYYIDNVISKKDYDEATKDVPNDDRYIDENYKKGYDNGGRIFFLIIIALPQYIMFNRSFKSNYKHNREYI